MLLKRFKSGSIPKVLLTYLVEVIIIFLGITISFLFEQWREDKRQQKELVELSESLLTDVGALKAKLTLDLDGSETWISELDSIRTQRISGKISESQLKWFHKMATGQLIFLFDPYSPTYMSAAGSGLINELPDSIRSELYNLYRVELPLFQLLYDRQQDDITNFRKNTMVPASIYLYTNESSSINPDLKIFAREIQQPIYGNFISQIIITEKKVIELNRDAFDTLTDLENSLRNYIDQADD